MTIHADIEKQSGEDADKVSAKVARGKRTINLALQGGGAHGAFTWGVLDRLIEDGRISFEGMQMRTDIAARAVERVAAR